MKLCFIVALLFAGCSAVHAQETAKIWECRIFGIVQDSLTQKGEEYATGRVYHVDTPDQPEKAFVTRNGGKFEFALTRAGTYRLRLFPLEKREVIKEFAVDSTVTKLDLGTLYTTQVENVMEEVVVSALRPLVKMDAEKLEYDVEQDPDSKTENVIEMLRKVPMVTVDAEENIEVNGSAKFKIHINGKPNNMVTNNPKEVLRSMPASSIKKIEVITNPGARYDAEGVSGILNIVTITDKMQGYTFSVNGGVGNRGGNGGLYGTIQSGKFTMTGRYGYNYYDAPKTTFNEERTTFTSEENYHQVMQGHNKGSGHSHNGGVEASYEFDTLRLLTVGGNVYLGNGDYDMQIATEMQDRQGDITYRYKNPGRSEYDYGWIGASLDYQRTFKRNKEELLTFSYRFNNSAQDSESRNVYEDVYTVLPIEETMLASLTNLRSKNDQNAAEHTFQADYANPIAPMHQIETGVKYILRRNSSTGDNYGAPLGTDIYTLDKERSSKYDHDQDILAAYLSYRLKWKDMTFKPGVRYEHTFQEMKFHQEGRTGFDVQYDDVVPSALLTYKLSESSNVRLAYNMRISRPSIWYLDPYVNRDYPGYISYGNPNLDTEKSHSFNLSYSYFSQKIYLNLSAYYTFLNNSIERYSFVQNDTLRSTYDNIGKRRDAGMSYYFNWSVTPKTRVYSNGSLSYLHYSSEAMDLRNHGFRLNLSGGIQQTLPWDIRLSLNGGGATRSIRLQGKGGSYYYYNASLGRDFLKKKLNVSFRASNFFNPYQKYRSYTETTDFRTISNSRNNRMNYSVNISYRIGELKAAVKKARRGVENDDVKSGGGGGGSAGASSE